MSFVTFTIFFILLSFWEVYSVHTTIYVQFFSHVGMIYGLPGLN